MRKLVAILSFVLVAGMLPPFAVAADPAGGVSSADPGQGFDPGPATDPRPTPEPSGSPTHALPTDPSSGTPDDNVEPLEVPVETTTQIVLTSGVTTVGNLTQFHVQVNPAPPAGTVDLLRDGTIVASAGVENGNADVFITWASPSAGNFTMTARFNGATGYAGSTSPDFMLLVLPPTPYITMTSSTDVPAFGETVAFTASLRPDPGSGTIEWLVDDVLVSTVALEAGGLSHFSTSFSTPGNHSVQAHFTGTAGFRPSTGNRNVSLAPLKTTMSITMPPAPIPAGPVTVSVTLVPNPGGGTLTWNTSISGYASVPVDADGTTDIAIGVLSAASYGLTVSFSGYGQYAVTQQSTAFDVLRTATITVTTSRSSAVQGELPVVLSAVVEPHDVWVGTVTFLDDVAGSVLTLGPVAYTSVDGKASISTSALRVGTHSIRAQFDGIDGVFVPALSSPISVTVAADTAVHASFKSSASGFYPYRDGYRDTVSLGGRLDETASVTIRVYSGSGSLKRTFSLGWRPAGSFAATWNGRTAGGSAVAAGKYTVKAFLKDSKGHTRTFVAYTTVSWRRVAWKTGTAVVRYGDQFVYYATPGEHLFYSDDYSRGRVLFSAEMNRNCEPDCATVYGYTTFTLKSTALAYRYVRVTITGHTYQGTSSGSAFFETWSTKSPAFKGPLPEYTRQPMTYTASPTANISADRKLRFGAWCSEFMGDAFDMHFVKLTYQYAVWS